MLTFCSILSVDSESGWFVSNTVHKTRTMGRHIGAISIVDIELQRTLCEANNEHTEVVVTDL